MDVSDIISRLSKVRQTGPNTWLACCPAHPDKSPSLSIRALPDGRILLHDFAGCGASDVVAALGLTVGDLFPKPIYQGAPRIRQPFTAMDALRALRMEAAVLAISVADFAEGQPVDQARIELAAARISDAAEYINAQL